MELTQRASAVLTALADKAQQRDAAELEGTHIAIHLPLADLGWTAAHRHPRQELQNTVLVVNAALHNGNGSPGHPAYHVKLEHGARHDAPAFSITFARGSDIGGFVQCAAQAGNHIPECVARVASGAASSLS